jgi:hypothetical protein
MVTWMREVAVQTEVLSLWPGAPILEVGRTGRWLRLGRAGDAAVYLQRYAWDAPCHPHYLVVRAGDGPAESPPEQWRYVDLAEALVAIRGLLARPRLRPPGPGRRRVGAPRRSPEAAVRAPSHRRTTSGAAGRRPRPGA